MESLSFLLSVPSIQKNPTPNIIKLKPQNLIKPSSTSQSLSPQNKHKKCLIKLAHPLLPFTLSTASLPSLAAVVVDPQPLEKINLEAIVVSIDNFFIKYPFFVTFVGVIWLVVIPLAQYYFGNYKYTYAIDAFQKLRDDPNAALLDIRDDKSVAFLGTPDLTLFNKTALHVHFREEDEDSTVFVSKVLEKFKDPANAVVCIIDNFDGSSLKVAELLAKNGFKEAYAIKGGVRGKRGWQEIQEDAFPPSVHVYPKIKAKGSNKLELTENYENLGNASLSQDNGSIKKTISSTSGPGKDL